MQNVAETAEPQLPLETTEPLNTTSAISIDENQSQSSGSTVISDDGSLIKTTVIRTTKIVKKISQQDGQDMSASTHSEAPSMDSFELAEEAAEQPKVEKSEMNSREISDEGVVRTTKTTTIRTIKIAKTEDKDVHIEPISEVEVTPESTEDTFKTEDGSVLKTTTVRTTRIVKKISQDSENVSETGSTSEPIVETIIQDAPIVAESVTTESNSEGITKTITTRTTKAVNKSSVTETVNEPDQTVEDLLIAPTITTETSNIQKSTLDFIASEQQNVAPVPDKKPRKSKKQHKQKESPVTEEPKSVQFVAVPKSTAAVEEPKEIQEVLITKPKEVVAPLVEVHQPEQELTVTDPLYENVSNDVVKTTIVRTTKIVKKVSQNVENQTVSEIVATPELDYQKHEEPIAVAEDPISEEAGGVTKTTTVRTTKIVKKLNEDGETTTEESSTVSEPITVREGSPTNSEVPSETSTTSSQIDGAIIKTTTIRTMRITKRITNDGRIVLTESDTPSDVVVTSSIEMPDQRPISPVITSSTTSPVVTLGSEQNVESVGVNIELGLRDTTRKSGVKVIGIETTELPTVYSEKTTSNGVINETDSIATTTTTTKNTILTTTQRRSFETEDGTNVLFVGEGIDGAYPPGTVQKISLITHEEKLKTPIVKMHLDFPEVSLRVTETVTENVESLQRTAELSENSLVEVVESVKSDIVESIGHSTSIPSVESSLKQIQEDQEAKTVSIEQVDKPIVVDEKDSEPPTDLSPEEQKLFDDIQKKLSKKDKKKRPAIPEEFIKQETIQVLVEESKEAPKQSEPIVQEVLKPITVIEAPVAENVLASERDSSSETITTTTTTVTETVSESVHSEQPKTTEPEVVEKPKQLKAAEPEHKPEEPKKTAYAGLPVDESSSSWMDVMDEPMVFSDEEEEPVVPVKVTETVVEKEIVKSVRQARNSH
ncbi:hypothetical protein ACLKA6_019315 [Drosophila palustris]